MRINELFPVVNEVWCCVFRRNSSRKVACLVSLRHLKAFLSLVLYHYFYLNVNCRKEGRSIIQGITQKTTRMEGSAPMNISKGILNPLKEEKEPQNSSEASITDFSCTTMVEWVLNGADTRNRQFNARGQELTESLFLQILSFIPNERKRSKRQKTHQGSPNQETEAVSDARLALIAHR